MHLKLVTAILVLAMTPAFAQQGRPQPPGPKPTKAEVLKVVQIITADKAKAEIYCTMSRLDDEIAEAESKGDRKKVEALARQADATARKLPEFVSLMARLQQIDPSSPEGKEFASLLDALDKLCGAQ